MEINQPQAQTPLTQGVNPENALYEAWKSAPDTTSRQTVESELLPYLRRHAAKVCWIVLHSYQPHLVEEIAQDALMELGTFEERSLFSTWFHARAYFRTRSEFRRIRMRREVGLDSIPVLTNSGSVSNLESSLLVSDILSKLTKQQRELVDLKVNYGLTDEELATRLNMSRAWVQKTWKRLRQKLRMLYGRSSR